jgi:hypothetical protein
MLKMSRYRVILILFLPLSLILGSCFSVKYSTTGAVIPPEIKTVGVSYFPNHAAIVYAPLSQQLTDGLRDKMRSQTNLKVTNDIGDVSFEGEITGYSTSSVAITGNQQAAQNRLTLTVRVKYTNQIDPSQNFDTSFSRYSDYSSTSDLTSVQDKLVKDMLELIIEDIYNKAFVNW